MPGYATMADLIERFGEAELIALTDRAQPPLGAPDAELAARALDDAARLIDGHVGRRYRLPLTAVPALLTQIACDLARHALYADAPTEAVKERAAAARRTLGDISTGRVVLDAEGAQPDRSGEAVLKGGAERVFDRDTLKGF